MDEDELIIKGKSKKMKKKDKTSKHFDEFDVLLQQKQKGNKIRNWCDTS